MRAFLKSIDYFSKKFDLTYKGKDRYNTVLGGLITVLSMLIIVFNGWLIGKDIYLRENPVVVGYDQALNFFPTTRMNYHDIFFSFFISDTLNNPFEDDSILKIIPIIYTNYYDKKGNLKYKEKFLEYTDCYTEFSRLNITPPLNPSIFSPLKCIKNFNEILSGFWTDTHISYLMFKAYSCNNITIEENTNIETHDEKLEFQEFENKIEFMNVLKMNFDSDDTDSNIKSETLNSEKNKTNKINYNENRIICKTPYEIKKIIPTLFFNFFYSGIVVNSKNYTNPMIVQINEDWFNLGTSIFKTIDYYFQNYIVRTDDGLIFSQDYTDINKLGYYKHLADYRSIEEGDNNIFWLNVYISNQVRYYTREYLKVQNIFANLGGIIQVVFISFKIFFAPYFNKKLNLKIINEIFDFDEIPDHLIDDCKTIGKNDIRRIDSLLNLKKNPHHKNYITTLNNSKLIGINKDKEKSELIAENGFIEESRDLRLGNKSKFEFYGESSKINKKQIKYSKKNSENNKDSQNYNFRIKKNRKFPIFHEKLKKVRNNSEDSADNKNQFSKKEDINFIPFQKSNNDLIHNLKNYDNRQNLNQNVDLLRIKSINTSQNNSKKINLNDNSLKSKIIIFKNGFDRNNISLFNDSSKNNLNKKNITNQKNLNVEMSEFEYRIDKNEYLKDISGKSFISSENNEKFININDKYSQKKEESKNIFTNISDISNYRKYNKNLENYPMKNNISYADSSNRMMFVKKQSKSLEKDSRYFKKLDNNTIIEKNEELSNKNEINSSIENKNFLQVNKKIPSLINFTLKEKLDEAINFKESKLKFKNFEILNSFYFNVCCRRKKLQEKNKLYNFAYENLNNYTDYLVIMKNFQDLTKMKYILFNTNQIFSFPFLSNPKKHEMGVHHEIQEYARAFDPKLSKQELAIEIFHYFKNKIKQDKLDRFDKKIWNIFNPKMKNMFIDTTYENYTNDNKKNF